MNYAPARAIPSIGRIDFAVPAMGRRKSKTFNRLIQCDKTPLRRREKQRNNSEKTAA
jgi:hypothetical protein